MRIIILVLSLLVARTHAVEYKKFEMNPPAAKAVNARRLQRYKSILIYKFQGYIGETEQGMLKVRDLSKAPAADRPLIQKTVDDENKDRLEWYKAVIAYNKLSEKQKGFLIKSSYDTFKGTDAKGTYHYENKKWQKKY